ncbi:undecaprenyl/decaprenyl-phosphate alpha-N-acetylglucosaminyl 1-phosphate transferase [Streptomyces sp. NPDC003393]
MLYGIATATSALLLAAVLSALLRVPALRLGMVDRRRVRPVPLLGGAAVVVSTCLVAAAGGWTGAAPLSDDVSRLLAAGAGVGVLGLAADVWRLKTRFLLVGTAVAAACVVPYDETGLPAGLAAVAWIACVTAAFRGLDHADGLAGTVGVLTAFGAGVCAAAEMMDDLAVLLSVLAAALTGFLMHNWHPARIAFGACGSLFTGFVLAAAGVLVRTGYEAGSTCAVLFALTAMATADAVLVVLSRRLAGRPVHRPGPDHLAHRLRRLGLTPPGATIVLGAGTFAAVLVGALIHASWLAPVGGLWLAGAVLAAVLGLLSVKVYGPRRLAEPHPTATRPGATGTYATATRSATTGSYATATRARAGAESQGAGARSRPAAGGYGTATRSRTVEGYGGYGTAARSGPRPADPYGTAVRSAVDAGTSRTPVVVSPSEGLRTAGALQSPQIPGDSRTAHIARSRRAFASRILPPGPARQPEYPAASPRLSTFSQVRGVLRVRDG